MNWIQIQWTCDQTSIIEEITHELIQKKLAACVNVIGPVQSFYYWQGRMEQTSEYKVLIKTNEKNFDTIAAIIEDKSDYETPEILALPILKVAKSYEKWLSEEVSITHP